MDSPNSMWRTTPLKTRITFLLAVFFIFAGIGFANDIINMGRQPLLRFALSVLIISVFAVLYAATGVILRRRFWKAFVPLCALQFLSMGLLARAFPDAFQAVQLNAAETDRLHARLAIDGCAVIASIALGYTGFVSVSISEGRRYLKSQTEKATLEGEMAAAREVQRVMVPENLPLIKGYALESVYRPAAEVGGDFFQVIPLQGGRTLIVIGDVSGKGLRAAMIVSMIVGMLSAVSSFTEEPAEILGELNRRLCGRTHGGFATCLVVRVDAGGRLTIANSGHLPPYLNGTEVPFAGSMPLGLSDIATYAQTSLDMRPGDRIVLLTDGIAEARNEQGALLGFPLVERLLCEGATAHVLAETARRHGQNDDITVISVTREV